MATVHSLVCWGGKDGKTAAITIASPCVVTITAHGLAVGGAVVLSTTGALPTGITAGAIYYAGNITANTFNVYDTEANALLGGATGRIDTSGTQSGVHTATSAYWNGLSTAQKARYGTAGSERAYGSLDSCVAARVGSANSDDDEIIEIGEAFLDVGTSEVTMNAISATFLITTKVDGIRSSAFHNGNYPSSFTNPLVSDGYIYSPTIAVVYAFNFLGFNQTIDGITIYPTRTNGILFRLFEVKNNVKNCLCVSGATGQTAVDISRAACSVLQNLIVGFANGIYPAGFNNSDGALVIGNTVVKGGTGFASATNSAGFYHNNVSVGNTTNWGAISAGLNTGGRNVGEAGDAPWYVGTDTSITTATADNTTFADWAGNDFRPAGPSSVLWDSAVTRSDVDAEDITGALRPSYNNGGAEAWDLGCYEYDNGFGLPPITVSLTGLLTGSTVRFFETGTTTIVDSTISSGTTFSPSVGNQTVDYEILKDGFEIIRATGVLMFDGLEIAVEQQVNKVYNASHGLAEGVDYTYNATTKTLAIPADELASDVYSSLTVEYRTDTQYHNQPFLLEAIGPKRIDLIDGATITSMATWKGAGMERYDAADAINPVEKWYAIQSVNNIAGSAVVYRQTNSGDFTVGSLTNNVFDETLQFYSDPDHDGTPATENNSYLLIKALRVGYRQARNDVVAGNGGASLKADSYTIGLAPTAHDYAGGPIDLSASMALTYGPFTVGGKTISYKWTDSATNSGTDIADWINYMGATSPNGIIPGGTGLRWAEMPDMVIYVSGGVETAQGYREGATPTLVGFYMERGGADHPDMVRAQADDGTYYTPPTLAGIQATNLTAGWAELYNVTTATLVESVAVTSGYSKTWTNGTDFTAGDTGRLRWRGEGSLPIQIDFIATTDTTVTALDTPETDESYDAFVSVHGVTGASITEFALDGSNVQFDITDPDNIWYAARLYIWYSYAMVSANGIATFWGAADSPDPTRIRLRNGVVDAYLDNTKAVSARQGDSIIVSRDDGVYPQAIPTSGGGGIGMYFTGVGFTSSSGSGLTAEQAAMLSAVNNKTGQLTFTVSGQVDSNCESMNGHALTGDGSESDKIRTVNAP